MYNVYYMNERTNRLARYVYVAVYVKLTASASAASVCVTKDFRIRNGQFYPFRSCM